MANDEPETPDAGAERKADSAPRLIHPVDLRLAVVILAICGLIYFITTSFEEVSPLLAQNIPPEWFPRLLIWTIVALTLILPFEHRFLEHGAKGLDEDRGERIGRMAIATAGLLLLVLGSAILFGTFIAMIVVCIAMPVLWGERRMKVLIPYVVLFPAAVTILFTQVLKVYFEPGLFGFEF